MMKNYPEFKNVSVIVTGVASGIGRAQAEKFLLEGAFVFGGDINDNEAVKNLKRRFPERAISSESVIRRDHPAMRSPEPVRTNHQLPFP